MFSRYARPTRLTMAAVTVLLITACGGGTDNTVPPVEIALPIPAARGLVPDLEQSKHLFETVHFSGSKSCAECHNDDSMVDSMGRDLSIETAWASSMMANSTRDPYWHAVVASELSLYPNLEEEINDTCSRCHAPMASEVARRSGEPLQIFDKGSEADGTLSKGFLSLNDQSELYNHAMDGVSCSLCHQIADDGNLGTEAGMTGGFHIEQYAEADKAERPAYGQYTDVDIGYMKGLANFTPVYSAHISTSETCATCHNLQSHSVDRNGIAVPDVGLFPEQMIYSEWENSDFRTGGLQQQSCQDCHMPKLKDRQIPIAGAGAGGAVHSDFAEHSFLGANTVMLEMLKTNRVALGIPDAVDFDAAIVRNRQFLKSAAEVSIRSSVVTDGSLDIIVDIINKTGHKLPGGYHSRRVFLHVLVTDESGQVVYENGRMNDDGSIAGVAEDTNPLTYEPHYNVIINNTQVQVYQSIMGNSDNERTHSLLNSTHYVKDNRLTPAGFDKNQVDSDIAVTGAAQDDVNFNAGKDTVKYQIPVSGDSGYSVLVELLYQPLSYGHLRALFAKSDKIDQIDMFRTLYESMELRAERIAADVSP